MASPGLKIHGNGAEVGGSLSDLSIAAKAVRQVCDEISEKLSRLDPVADLMSKLDFQKIEKLLRNQVDAGRLPDILKD